MEDERVKQKLPVGIILVLALIGFSAVSYLLVAFRVQSYQLGPVLISGGAAAVIGLIIAAILAAAFYGILRRMEWARKLTIGWYVFSIIILLLNLFSFLGDKRKYDAYYEQLLPPELHSVITPGMITFFLAFASGFGFVVGIIVIVYLISRKNFFVNNK